MVHRSRHYTSLYSGQRSSVVVVAAAAVAVVVVVVVTQMEAMLISSSRQRRHLQRQAIERRPPMPMHYTLLALSLPPFGVQHNSACTSLRMAHHFSLALTSVQQTTRIAFFSFTRSLALSNSGTLGAAVQVPFILDQFGLCRWAPVDTE